MPLSFTYGNSQSHINPIALVIPAMPLGITYGHAMLTPPAAPRLKTRSLAQNSPDQDGLPFLQIGEARPDESPAQDTGGQNHVVTLDGLPGLNTLLSNLSLG